MSWPQGKDLSVEAILVRFNRYHLGQLRRIESGAPPEQLSIPAQTALETLERWGAVEQGALTARGRELLQRGPAAIEHKKAKRDARIAAQLDAWMKEYDEMSKMNRYRVYNCKSVVWVSVEATDPGEALDRVAMVCGYICRSAMPNGMDLYVFPDDPTFDYETWENRCREINARDALPSKPTKKRER